jgi:hypothetical protein
MLVWINGPFGGGKTQTAYEIQRRLPGSVVCDPEHVGFGLHRMTPAQLRGDFQDLPAWRQGVYEVLDMVLTKHEGPAIAPMTLLRPDYFQEIIGRLRERGHQVRHFALLAEYETVLKRLRERKFGHALQAIAGGHAPRLRESFAGSKIEICLERLSGPEFAAHIQTDRLTVAQVADLIAGSAGLTLRPNTDSALKGHLRQTRIKIKHIRLD